ncbi:hypothetical protein [Pontibacter harenae]|uniref:hypothetical protein n=1 Tax=Pontibacter harenae TaxID=2894083 RepID=UPI001E2DBFB4|nr:hypothetical protein [Pontibacter harenae]MCC9166302.1 hypothetical protein [Pontibacter harenae]
MKKMYFGALAFIMSLSTLCSCTSTDSEENYVEVIGEYEQQMPEAGYRLNLSYNGPLAMRDKFVVWADSLKRLVPTMAKTSENIGCKLHA